MQTLSRRSLIVSPLILGGLGAALESMGAEAQEPHFFLQIHIHGGLDSLYLFDSRPKIFTEAGLMANYEAEEARRWESKHGGSSWAGSASELLRPFKDRLAIVNGIHMPPGFDGHEQNVNSILTANPFGGKYFAPQISGSALPLPFVGFGDLTKTALSNKATGLLVSSETAQLLAQNAQKAGASGTEASWKTFLKKRAAVCGEGRGKLAKGCAAYAAAMPQTASLAGKLTQTQTELDPQASELVNSTAVALNYFKQSLTRVALVSHRLEGAVVDTHAAADAARSPEVYQRIAADIAACLELLLKTPFQAERGLSMLDVTTVMISSEFSRTHVQAGKTVDQTGTDHNPLSNSVLFAGKGIKGDHLVGASDLDEVGENRRFKDPSPAHRRMDAELQKRMGKPFDFATQTVSERRPETYQIQDYISAPSVMNTVLSLFGIPEKDWLSLDNRANAAQGPAPILATLLS